MSVHGFSLPALAQGRPAGVPTAVTGELTIVHADDFDNHREQSFYFLTERATNRLLSLRVSGRLPAHVQTGAIVTVRGQMQGDELVLAADAADSITTVAAATAAAVSGEQRTIVMLVNFRDKALSCSANTVRDIMFANPTSSIDLLYQQTSFQQVWLTGQVVGPFTIDYTSTEACSYWSWASAADAAAQASGIDLSQYRRRVYVLPSNVCPWSGYGTFSGNPSRAWIFRCDRVGVYAHELGHNFGMHHASTPSAEYGDTSDVMGSTSAGLRQVNGPHKAQMGWVPPEQVRHVTSSGFYDVAPLEVDPWNALAPQVLQIAKPDTNDYYYLSYRRPLGFDANLSSTYVDQLNIHRYKGSGTVPTYFLDALRDGDSFTDTVNGMTIIQKSRTNDAVTVQVLMGSACTPNVPTVSMTPPSQYAAPGTTLEYTVTLTNQDSAFCLVAAWSLSSVVPAGWTATLSPSTLSLAPGTTGSATLAVTSASDAAEGNYGVEVDVMDSREPLHTTFASATYAVMIDDEPPTAPTRLSATLRGSRVDLSWTAATDDVGVSGYAIWRNGLHIGNTTTTRYSDSAVSTGATYTYWVVAYDAAGNMSAPSNTVTLTIQKGGKK